MTEISAQPTGQALDQHASAATSLRILAVSHTWQGANDYSYVRAFRRAEHSVTVASDEAFFPAGWRNPMLKAVRRVLQGAIIAEYNRHLIEMARMLQPQLFFVYKGTFVTAEALKAIKETGAVAINVYPDTQFILHSSMLIETMRLYDWVFTTKSFHVEAPPVGIDAIRISFLPHGFDPEVHRPVNLDAHDSKLYRADLSYIATWTIGKERLIGRLRELAPEITMKIWGNQWERATTDLGPGVMRHPVLGFEYAKAIRGGVICLAAHSEQMGDATQADLVSARTFEIPATGGFMLHERNAEVARYFQEGRECAMFEGLDELAHKVRYYLQHRGERDQIAAAGRARCLSSGSSVDDRAKAVIAKVAELRSR